MGGVILLYLLLVRLLQKIYKKDCKSSKPQLPPYAPTTMMKTIHALTHGQHPWFFLDLQKQMYPIKLFRLPISFTKPWIIIGDVNIALKVDKDIHTKRPTIGYTDIASCIGSGGSIVTLEGAEWKHRRLATNVVFASHNLKRMSSVMETCAEYWMETTLGDDETKSFDVGKEMVGLTIKIILESAFDYKATTTEAEFLSSELLICSQEFAKVSGGLNPLRKISGPLFSNEVRRAKLARQNVFNFALKIINGYQENNKDDSKTCTLLSCIMNNPSYKDDNERASDIVMWMNAGFDNTGFAISWVLLDLARHPMIVSSLRDELKLVPQKDWHKSSSIRNICKESMRLNPVTPGGSLRVGGERLYL